MSRGLAEFAASWCSHSGPYDCNSSACVWASRYGCTHPHHPDNSNAICDGCNNSVDRAEIQKVGLKLFCSSCRRKMVASDNLLHPSRRPGACEE